MQVAQTAEKRVVPGFERCAGVTAAGLLIVTPLQVGACTKSASRAGHDKASNLAAPVVDRIERLSEAAQHIHGDSIHNLRMIELQDSHRTIDIERDVLELHLFPRELWPRLLLPWRRVSISIPYLIFWASLSMVVRKHLPPTDARVHRAPNQMETRMSIFDLSGRVAVITGGNSGIGLGIAQALAAAG